MERIKRKLGDFVLIVVSVLLALAAENWLQDQAMHARSDQYLAALERDLQADSAISARWLQISDSKASAIETLLADLERPAIEARSALLFLWAAQSVLRPEYAQATYADLVSTGNIGLLPPGLRRSLVRYRRGIEDYEQRVAQRERAVGPREFWRVLPGRATDSLAVGVSEKGPIRASPSPIPSSRLYRRPT